MQGHQTWVFKNSLIIGSATVVGPLEGQGPLAEDFDIIHEELMMGRKLGKSGKGTGRRSNKLAIENAGLTKEQVALYWR